MPAKYICPKCRSGNIGKQEEDKEYFCDDCCSFFEEPELLTTDKKKGEDRNMGNRYKTDLDREKIRALAADKTVPEIAAATGWKISSIRSAMHAMGIKAKVSYSRRPRKLKSGEIQSKDKIVNIKTVSKSLENITVLDALIAERNQCQDYVFKLNKAIEILS